MYTCEICGTCSRPKEPCLRRWGFLGYYRELKVCPKCYAALARGRTVRELLGPPASRPIKIALPTTIRRI
jgi:hypothetical protein